MLTREDIFRLTDIQSNPFIIDFEGEYQKLYNILDNSCNFPYTLTNYLIQFKYKILC